MLFRSWLCVLANPLLPAHVNLRTALDRADMPEAIALAFAGLLGRRLLWWQRLLERNDTTEPILPKPGPVWANEAAYKAMDLAGLHAARHHYGEAKGHQQARGAKREAAWLVARLVELLMKEFPREVVAPTPAMAKHGRRK